MKSNTNTPYHHPDFRTLRSSLDPGFPDNYPYSQYVNNKGELVFTPWRDSVDGHQRKKETSKERVIFVFGLYGEEDFVVFFMCLHGFFHSDRIYLSVIDVFSML